MSTRDWRAAHVPPDDPPTRRPRPVPLGVYLKAHLKGSLGAGWWAFRAGEHR